MFEKLYDLGDDGVVRMKYSNVGLAEVLIEVTGGEVISESKDLFIGVPKKVFTVGRDVSYEQDGQIKTAIKGQMIAAYSTADIFAQERAKDQDKQNGLDDNGITPVANYMVRQLDEVSADRLQKRIARFGEREEDSFMPNFKGMPRELKAVRRIAFKGRKAFHLNSGSFKATINDKSSVPLYQKDSLPGLKEMRLLTKDSVLTVVENGNRKNVGFKAGQIMVLTNSGKAGDLFEVYTVTPSEAIKVKKIYQKNTDLMNREIEGSKEVGFGLKLNVFKKAKAAGK